MQCKYVINILQPKIELGDVAANREAIASLFDRLDGDLGVLPEYCLTGSLVWLAAEQPVDLPHLAAKSTAAAEELGRQAPIPLVIHWLEATEDNIYNSAGLWVGKRLHGIQQKQNPDQQEQRLGISVGKEGYPVFHIGELSFQVVICTDIRYFAPSLEVDFVLWVSHYPKAGHEERIVRILRTQQNWRVPMVVSSPVGGSMIGHSMVMHQGKILCELGEEAGVLSWAVPYTWNNIGIAL